mmetsp:Transcript_31956/g.82768  ORF Transcript_31956/g.82768 Transcript_31956/m.82768 type:complete len:248 (-) Transcript_31956:117-860(-)
MRELEAAPRGVAAFLWRLPPRDRAVEVAVARERCLGDALVVQVLGEEGRLRRHASRPCWRRAALGLVACAGPPLRQETRRAAMAAAVVRGARHGIGTAPARRTTRGEGRGRKVAHAHRRLALRLLGHQVDGLAVRAAQHAVRLLLLCQLRLRRVPRRSLLLQRLLQLRNQRFRAPAYSRARVCRCQAAIQTGVVHTHSCSGGCSGSGCGGGCPGRRLASHETLRRGHPHVFRQLLHAFWAKLGESAP